MPSPPHPRLRNRHSLPRAVSNGAHPSDYAARQLWTAIPCESLEYRGVVPTSESSTTRKVARPVNARAFVSTNPKDEPMTSWLPVIQAQSQEQPDGRQNLAFAPQCPHEKGVGSGAALSRLTSPSAIHRYAMTRRSRPISGGASSTRAKPALFEMLSSSAKV